MKIVINVAKLLQKQKAKISLSIDIFKVFEMKISLFKKHWLVEILLLVKIIY